MADDSQSTAYVLRLKRDSNVKPHTENDVKHSPSPQEEEEAQLQKLLSLRSVTITQDSVTIASQATHMLRVVRRPGQGRTSSLLRSANPRCAEPDRTTTKQSSRLHHAPGAARETCPPSGPDCCIERVPSSPTPRRGEGEKCFDEDLQHR